LTAIVGFLKTDGPYGTAVQKFFAACSEIAWCFYLPGFAFQPLSQNCQPEIFFLINGQPKVFN